MRMYLKYFVCLIVFCYIFNWLTGKTEVWYEIIERAGLFTVLLYILNLIEKRFRKKK